MSEQTKAALDAAIEAHIADECPGGIVTGYVLQTKYTDVGLIEGRETGFLSLVHESQDFIATLGLITYMKAVTEGHLMQGE